MNEPTTPPEILDIFPCLKDDPRIILTEDRKSGGGLLQRHAIFRDGDMGFSLLLYPSLYRVGGWGVEAAAIRFTGKGKRSWEVTEHPDTDGGIFYPDNADLVKFIEGLESAAATQAK